MVYGFVSLNCLVCEKTVDINSKIIVQYIYTFVYTLGAAEERLSVSEFGCAVE